jgi:hypothetical protein
MRCIVNGLLTTKWYRAEQPIHLLPRWLEIVLWFSIAIIIAFAFASELGFSSHICGAYYCGCGPRTQSVLLSIAGYFFLVGRFGVRVGDRVLRSLTSFCRLLRQSRRSARSIFLLDRRVEDWQRTLRGVFEQAGIPDGHAHRFRDTLAVELPQADIPMERVSVLLGHNSIKVTEKHYSPWVRARQEQLEADCPAHPGDLDVLEPLFDFYCVQPEATAKKRKALEPHCRSGRGSNE